MALSTHGKSHVVLSAWMTSGTFALCPDKYGFCCYFLEASMPEAGWLPFQPDPIVFVISLR